MAEESKAHEKKETKTVEKTEKKQRVHKDTNTAIRKGLQKAKAKAGHDSANCDSDYCTIC